MLDKERARQKMMRAKRYTQKHKNPPGNERGYTNAGLSSDVIYIRCVRFVRLTLIL